MLRPETGLECFVEPQFAMVDPIISDIFRANFIFKKYVKLGLENCENIPSHTLIGPILGVFRYTHKLCDTFHPAQPASADILLLHSVLIKPATLEVRHFLNLTSRTVLLFFLVLYVIVEQSAVLILWICSLLILP